MIVFGFFAFDNIIIMTKIERKYDISQKKENLILAFRVISLIFTAGFFLSRGQAYKEFRSVSQTQV